MIKTNIFNGDIKMYKSCLQIDEKNIIINMVILW